MFFFLPLLLLKKLCFAHLLHTLEIYTAIIPPIPIIDFPIPFGGDSRGTATMGPYANALPRANGSSPWQQWKAVPRDAQHPGISISWQIAPPERP